MTLNLDAFEARANAALRRVKGVELSIATILLAQSVLALIAEVRRMRAVVDASVKLYEAEDYSDSVRDMRHPYSVAWHARKLAYAAWCDAVAAYKAQEES